MQRLMMQKTPVCPKCGAARLRRLGATSTGQAYTCPKCKARAVKPYPAMPAAAPKGKPPKATSKQHRPKATRPPGKAA